MYYQTIFIVPSTWTIPGFWDCYFSVFPFLFLFFLSLFSSKKYICFIALFFVIFFVVIGTLAINKDHTPIYIAHPENIRLVEGTVSKYREWAKSEEFCVKDACFQYSDFVWMGGFHTTAKYGGPIKEGLPVRIRYYPSAFGWKGMDKGWNNEIIQLDVGTQEKSR